MSDGVKSEISSDIDQKFSLNAADPKNVQELPIYVSIDCTDKVVLWFFNGISLNSGTNFTAKCSRQIPIDVGSSNFTH